MDMLKVKPHLNTWGAFQNNFYTTARNIMLCHCRPFVR